MYRKKTGTVLLLSATAACYLSPDSTPTDESSASATTLDGGLADGSAQVDTGPVDAGCTTNDFCSATAPLCSGGDCVACQQHEDCARFVETPACGASGSCVACAPGQKKLCGEQTPACDPNTSRCVQCVADADCGSDQAPACQPDLACGKCEDDAQCARFGKVCDARTGGCVACHPETEEADCRTDKACDPELADCAGTACDPKTLSCTSKPRGSVNTCQSCVSDSECAASHGCIPLFFGEGATREELGGYCMKVAATGCMRPYGTPLTRDSLSGKPAQPYCGLSELYASCEALRALDENKTCTGTDDSCGVDGGRCETVNFIANSCSYACRSALECPPEVPCGGPAEDRYCGGAL
jgi:hypothetical protein